MAGAQNERLPFVVKGGKSEVKYHEITINKRTGNEAYRNVYGYELEVDRNAESIGNWINDEEISEDYRRAIDLMERLADFIKERESFNFIEKPQENIRLVLEYYEIGD